MEVAILAFGISKEIFSSAQINFEIKNGMTVGDLKRGLEKKYPRLTTLKSYMIAVNKAYAHDALIILPQDEIAVIPPVSGG